MEQKICKDKLEMLIKISPKDKKYKILSRDAENKTMTVTMPDGNMRNGIIRSLSTNGSYEVELLKEE